jgi:sulfate adenylyltransferase subunit 1 (EFTu-like GTPase family)
MNQNLQTAIKASLKAGEVIMQVYNTTFDVAYKEDKSPLTEADKKAMIKEVVYKIDINTLGRNNEDKELVMNDIAKVRIRTTQPLMVDSYRENRTTGSIILVDDATNETVAAGMIV